MSDDDGFKTLLTDAIVGIGFPSLLLATEVERAGMARFTGNALFPAWEWCRERLMCCRVEQLQELYQGLCEARAEASVPTEEKPCL